MSKIKTKDLKIVTVRVTEQLRDKIDAHIETKDAHISRNLWIVQLIEKELKRVNNKKE